mgnify:CR=1 FL=1
MSDEKEKTGFQQPHNVILEDRHRLSISGVQDIDSYDEQSVIAFTELGELTIKGFDLHINKIDVQTGELDLEGAEPLGPLAGRGAHAWYKNLPKRFVAGCLVDFDSREVVVGAEAVLVDEAGTEVARMSTDEFGDFLFDQVEPAAYTVRVASRELAADVREKDLNLGDIALR